MGTFYLDCLVENWPDVAKSVMVPGMLVDTGAENTWIPTAILQSIGIEPQKRRMGFTMANGQTITRDVGFAVIR